MVKKLNQLWANTNAFPALQIIATEGDSNITWQNLLERSQTWNKQVAKTPTKSIAIYHDNGIDFLALLFACWRNNKTAIIPANTLTETCRQLQLITPTLLGQFPNDTETINKQYSNDSANAALTIFTSGSSGVPTPIHKSFAQLDNELHTLEQCWGETLNNVVITGTVSHHHIYGLLFRLLWPLCSGRKFTSTARSYWEEIIVDSQRCEKIALVSSPVHYKNMPALQWQSLASITTIAFSSGAPLSKDSANTAKKALTQAVIEVYGSSETGGVAWRNQLSNDAWTCLPNTRVKIDDNSLLNICGPHLPNSDWYQTADKAEIASGNSFKLLGRADNIVKISGKRVSLSQIENSLLAHPWVTDAKVIQLTQKEGRLSAAIVLNGEGNNYLIDQGKISINKVLQRYLSDSVDAIALPRYWRYLAVLPENQQGKTTVVSIAALFGNGEQTKYPHTKNIDHIDSNNCQIDLIIPANLYYFNGHFLGRPILPGVVQVHWAIHYGKELFSITGAFQRLEVVKFQRVIRPEEAATLKLEYNSSKTKLIFSYSNNDSVFSSGRIVFGGHSNDV